MTATSGTDYTAFMSEGDKYLKTARGGVKRPTVFTSEILYNIIGLAIEKHVMGALMAKGKLADNHTFTDLIDAANQVGDAAQQVGDSVENVANEVTEGQ